MVIGFLLGYITSVISFWLGFAFSRYCSSPATGKPFEPPMRRKERKMTPKALSDEELWRREQKEAPADPIGRHL